MRTGLREWLRMIPLISVLLSRLSIGHSLRAGSCTGSIAALSLSQTVCLNPPTFHPFWPIPLDASSSASQYRWARGSNGTVSDTIAARQRRRRRSNKVLGWGRDEGMTLSSFIQRAADIYPHKRALAYLDGKGKETEIQSLAEVRLCRTLWRNDHIGMYAHVCF